MNTTLVKDTLGWGETGLGPCGKAGLNAGEGGGVAQFVSRRICVTWDFLHALV